MHVADLTPELASASPAPLTWRSPSSRAPDAGLPGTRPRRVIPEAKRQQRIHAAFAEMARLHPDRIALDDGTLRVTYADMGRRVLALAARILDGDMPAGAIGILVPNGIDFPIAMMACLAAGRPFVALDQNYPAEHNARVIRRAALAAIILDRDAGALPSIPLAVLRIDLARKITAPLTVDDRRLARLALSLDAPAIILYTSGSTGRPKGIVNSQRAILARVWQHVEACRSDETDVFMTLSSPCTIAGIRETFTALLTGANLRLLDQRRCNFRQTCAAFRYSCVTICYAVPALLRAMVAADSQPRETFASLRVLRIGGEPVLWTDIDLLRPLMPETCGIFVGYSSTETPGAGWFLPPGLPRTESPSVPVGYMLPPSAFAIDRGELVVASNAVALGYWEEGRCVPGPVEADPDDQFQRILRTGDLVEAAGDGLLTIVGRTDRQVKIRGQRVEPAELEIALRRQHCVVDAAVVVARAMNGEAELVAFVVLQPCRPESLHQIRTALRSGLPSSLYPARLHALATLPRMPGGKLDAKALLERDAALREGGPRPAEDKRDDALALLGRQWSGIVGGYAQGATWDEAGGNSLQLLRMVFELEEVTGRSLPQGLFTPDMTVAAMASALAGALARTTSAPEGDTRPKLFLMPGVGGDEPLLTPLRTDLGSRMDLQVTVYRGWSTIGDPRITFADKVADIASAIAAEQPAGQVRLLGYSYGGIVAFGVARQLLRYGREIAYLGLLDTDIAAPRPAPRTGAYGLLSRLAGIRRSLSRAHLHDDLCRNAAHYLRSPRMQRLTARLLDPERSPLSFGVRFSVHFWLCRERRLDMARQWLASLGSEEFLPPTVLFRSDERQSDSPELGWGRFCRDLRIVDVGGNHTSLLLPPRRETVTKTLLEMEAAG